MNDINSFNLNDDYEVKRKEYLLDKLKFLVQSIDNKLNYTLTDDDTNEIQIAQDRIKILQIPFWIIHKVLIEDSSDMENECFNIISKLLTEHKIYVNSQICNDVQDSCNSDLENEICVEKCDYEVRNETQHTMSDANTPINNYANSLVTNLLDVNYNSNEKYDESSHKNSKDVSKFIFNYSMNFADSIVNESFEKIKTVVSTNTGNTNNPLSICVFNHETSNKIVNNNNETSMNKDEKCNYLTVEHASTIDDDHLSASVTASPYTSSTSIPYTYNKNVNALYFVDDCKDSSSSSSVRRHSFDLVLNENQDKHSTTSSSSSSKKLCVEQRRHSLHSVEHFRARNNNNNSNNHHHTNGCCSNDAASAITILSSSNRSNRKRQIKEHENVKKRIIVSNKSTSSIGFAVENESRNDLTVDNSNSNECIGNFFVKLTLKSILSRSNTGSSKKRTTFNVKSNDHTMSSGEKLLNNGLVDCLKKSKFVDNFCNVVLRDSYSKVNAISSLIDEKFSNKLSDKIVFDAINCVKIINVLNNDYDKLDFICNHKDCDTVNIDCLLSIFCLILVFNEYEFKNQVRFNCDCMNKTMLLTQITDDDQQFET